LMSILIKIASFGSDFPIIAEIRSAVFQIEQGIKAEDEFDGKDAESLHLLAYVDNQPVGTLRIRNIDNETIKIERLAVLRDFRAQGLGKKLMEQAIALVGKPHKSVQIHAQLYLEKFYLSLGFVAQGESFREAGIAHILMVKDLQN
jgi:predicted GNAT family N-acyltransferase